MLVAGTAAAGSGAGAGASAKGRDVGRDGLMDSPNGHHSKRNIPGRRLVSTPDVVHFVCLRQDDVMMLQHDGVRVDAALQTGCERKGETRCFGQRLLHGMLRSALRRASSRPIDRVTRRKRATW